MSDSAQNEARSEKKSNKAVIILIALLALLVVLLIVVIILLLGRGGKESSGETERLPAEPARTVAETVRTVVDEESAESVMNQMREEVAEGMFECEMSMTWTFKDGKSESKDAYVANSVNNTHPIFFDVYLKDTEELLYSSSVLPVGTNVTDIKLDKELPAGSYSATVMYSLLKDEQSQEVISNAGFVIKIDVLN